MHNKKMTLLLTGSKLILCGAFVLLLHSCFHDGVIHKNSSDSAIKSMTVLVGKKKENPYSLRNIRKAQRVLEKKEKGLRVAASKLHWYVKFKPVTSAEVKLLENDSLRLFDFPLDHELTALPDSAARYYTAYADGQLPELYTVVDEGYTFPSVEHTVLDTLYFPSEAETDLEYETNVLTGNLKDTTQAGGINGRTQLFGFGTRPSGYVRLYDTEKGVQPVVGAYVQVIYYGRIVGTYTNTAGYFQLSERFLVGSYLSVLFDNGFCKIKPFDTHSTLAALTIPAQLALPAIYLDGWYAAGNLDEVNVVFQNNSQARLWATITNATYWFNQYARVNGMNWPGKLNIYAQWGRAGGDSSTPMLNYVSGISNVTGIVNQVLQDLSLVFSSGMSSAIINSAPDVTIKQGAYAPIQSADLMQVIFHELGHASHYARVGGNFWRPYIQDIVRNGGYGSRSDSDSGRIALSEAWAEYIGDLFALKYYGQNVKISGHPIPNALEDKTSDWIPYGIYYDLTDPYNSAEPDDNVSNFVTSTLYSKLTADIADPTAYRYRLEGLALSSTSPIDILFKWYGY